MSVEGYLFKWVDGETLGDAFLLKERLGKGTYGVVGRAIRLQDTPYAHRGDEVALKVPIDQDVGEENLKREPEVIRQFNHENIVKVYPRRIDLQNMETLKTFEETTVVGDMQELHTAIQDRLACLKISSS